MHRSESLAVAPAFSPPSTSRRTFRTTPLWAGCCAERIRIQQALDSSPRCGSGRLDPSGRQTTLDYDKKRAPLRFARDGVDLARFRWSEDHNECAMEFWDGTRAQSFYSPAGRPVRLLNRTGASDTFEYDAENRLLRLIDGRGSEVGFSYDEMGRPSTTRYPDGRAETPQYDAQGHWVGTLLNGDQIFERESDPQHRPLSVTYADGRKDTFQYDDQGRLTAAAGPEGALTFGYDDKGRPNAEASAGDEFKLAYDKSGLLTGLEYPGGLRATYSYDADKRLASVDWGGATIAFGYHGQDKQVRATYSNQLTTSTTLASSGKPSRATTTDSRTGVVCCDTQYQYDPQDRLSARNDAEFGVRQYVYDGESQLLGVADGKGAWRETFTYDAAGNRVATSGQAAVVDAGNRVLAQGNVVCKYDHRGNLVHLSDSSGTWRFEYDLKNQMTEAHGPAGVIKFKYDAIGRRIEKKTPVRTIRYAWCGEGLAREVTTSAQGESVREYLYWPGRYEPLAVRVDGRCYFYHNDHQGTPQRITDPDGKVVWSADYFAFGYAQVRSGEIENPLRFAGQYADPETGLHYNRFRYYSPVLGRYVSVDPLRLLAGNNLYLYVKNNPLNKLDGLGLWSVLGVVGAVAAAAAVVVAAPFVLVAAPLLVAGGLLVAEAISVGGDFCSDCFWRGFDEAFIPGLIMGAGVALVLGAVAAFSAPAALVGGVVIGCIFAYQMLDTHFGWSGGKPFEQMTPNEKSEAIGRLAGGTLGAIVGGLGMGEIVGFSPKAAPVRGGPKVDPKVDPKVEDPKVEDSKVETKEERQARLRKKLDEQREETLRRQKEQDEAQKQKDKADGDAKNQRGLDAEKQSLKDAEANPNRDTSKPILDSESAIRQDNNIPLNEKGEQPKLPDHSYPKTDGVQNFTEVKNEASTDAAAVTEKFQNVADAGKYPKQEYVLEKWEGGTFSDPSYSAPNGTLLRNGEPVLVNGTPIQVVNKPFPR